MELTPYIDTLKKSLTTAAAPGGKEVAAAANLLSDALEPSARLCLLDAMADASDEITAALDEVTVEARLHGREIEFIVTEVVHPQAVPAPSETSNPDASPGPGSYLVAPAGATQRLRGAGRQRGEHLRERMDRPIDYLRGRWRRWLGPQRRQDQAGSEIYWLRAGIAVPMTVQFPKIFSRKEIPMSEYPYSGPITIKASVAAGSLKITTEERDSVIVDVTSPGDGAAAEATEVKFDGNTLEIESPRDSRRWFGRDDEIDVVVKAPLDSSASIGVASASLQCSGRYAEMDVKTASGDVEIEEVAGDLEISSASGDTRLSSVGGRLSFRSASGKLEVSGVGGKIGMKTASGRIEIGDAGSDVKAQSASGRLQVDSVRRGTVVMKTASGKVSVGVVLETRVWLDLNSTSDSVNSGLDTIADPPEHRDLTIQISTTSGSIDILRAPEPATV